jgi:hypothetical protein
VLEIVHAAKTPLIRKEIFEATVVEVGDPRKGYKVETGGDDFISEDVGGKNRNDGSGRGVNGV